MKRWILRIFVILYALGETGCSEIDIPHVSAREKTTAEILVPRGEAVFWSAHGIDVDNLTFVKRDLSLEDFKEFLPGYIDGYIKKTKPASGSSSYFLHMGDKGFHLGPGHGYYTYVDDADLELKNIELGKIYRFYGRYIGDGHKGLVPHFLIYGIEKC